MSQIQTIREAMKATIEAADTLDAIQRAHCTSEDLGQDKHPVEARLLRLKARVSEHFSTIQTLQKRVKQMEGLGSTLAAVDVVARAAGWDPDQGDVPLEEYVRLLADDVKALREQKATPLHARVEPVSGADDSVKSLTNADLASALSCACDGVPPNLCSLIHEAARRLSGPYARVTPPASIKVTRDHRWRALLAWEGADPQLSEYERAWVETGEDKTYPRYERMAQALADADAGATSGGAAARELVEMREQFAKADEILGTRTLGGSFLDRCRVVAMNLSTLRQLKTVLWDIAELRTVP